jgi:hypothetical protein
MRSAIRTAISNLAMKTKVKTKDFVVSKRPRLAAITKHPRVDLAW